MTAAVLLLVFTLVEAPEQGWGSPRTLGSFALTAGLLAAFVIRERRTPQPLVRLGILRSGSLVRANLGGLSLFGAWVGFQFLTTLYLQQLRRHGTTRPILAGLTLNVAAYALFVPIARHSNYLDAMLPTFILTGLGFALALGPLNIAATKGPMGLRARRPRTSTELVVEPAAA
jgi:hypothetical protein